MYIRIISGTHRGRKIQAPKSLPVRPTTDFAKESLFNILNNHLEFDGLHVLDLFSGSGNISFEFASRGAKMITAVDSNPKCCAFIKKTAADLGFDNIRTVKSDAFTFLKGMNARYGIIFADAPYDLKTSVLIPGLVYEKNMLEENGILIVEHDKKMELSGEINFKEKRTYGNVNFSIFQETYHRRC